MTRTLLLMSTAAAALLWSGSATAQSDTANAPVAAETTGDIANGQPEDVVVTAQKRQELLIDVPQSVSVVGQAALERNQATNFKDYLKLVPGLQLNQETPGFGRLVLRGVNTGSVASTVAVYLDETTFGSSSGLTNGAILAGDFDTFDIARIEVLRGPQGTLYGANALGGILKFVSNAPDTTKIEARARGSVETVRGGDESYMGSAMLNLPISDTLAVRGSGFYRNIGGFIDSIGTGGSDVQNDINGSESYGGRGSILFKPTSDFSVQLNAYLQNLDVKAGDRVDADPLDGGILYNRLSQSQFVPERSRIRYRVYNGVLDYDFGFASLVSSTSYSTLRQTFRRDLTVAYSPIIEAVFGTPNEFFQDQTTRVRRFSQEVRLQSSQSDIFEWLVGGYYTDERGLIDQTLTAVEPGTFTEVAGLPLLGIATVRSRYEEIAGFANATIHLGQKFDLTFGGRYSHNNQRADQESDGALAGGAAVLPTARSKEDVFTWSVSPKFKVSDNASLYVRVAKGFRPGGPNTLPPGADPAFRTYRSDSLISYEAGVKAQTADRTFSIDAAAFHIDWSDVQVFGTFIIPPPGVSFGANFNGGKAESNGFEFTATARPTRGFTVSANGAYTDAHLRDDTPADVGGLDGDRLPYTPEISVAVNADYEWSLGGSLTAFVGGSIRTVSKQTASYNAALRAANDGQQPSIPSFTTTDLRAGIDFDRFSVEVYAKNLNDARGLTSLDFGVGNVPNGASSAGVIRPRTFGVTLGAGF